LLVPGTHTRAPLCDLFIIFSRIERVQRFNVNPALFIILANPSSSTTNRRFTDGWELLATMCKRWEPLLYPRNDMPAVTPRGAVNYFQESLNLYGETLRRSSRSTAARWPASRRCVPFQSR